MNIELSQFSEVFFEESFEGLDSMETDLLQLDGHDEETINAIFRAAHSIKGGAGMFGFMPVQDFTHILETLLDEIRNGKRQVSDELVSLFLESVDCIRALLHAAKAGEKTLPEGVESVQIQLADLLKPKIDSKSEATDKNTPADTEKDASAAPKQSKGWNITFKPFAEMLASGNEPLRMFYALSELGELKVESILTDLPPLKELDPELCYLSWQLQLLGDISLADVNEVFEWVEGDCELLIQPLDDAGLECELENDQRDDRRRGDRRFSSLSRRHDNRRIEGDSDSDVHEKDNRRSNDRRNPETERRANSRRTSETQSIRVATDKVDSLINRVGELVITQSMLSQIEIEDNRISFETIEALRAGLLELERNTKELQEDVMRIRLLPISFVFNRFPRLVHDLQESLGKKIQLTMIGQETELDKSLLEKIADPLVHLVRNAIDHGIEAPEKRAEIGKPEHGNIFLEASHFGGNILIEIRDDGQGLDVDRILQKAIEKGLVYEADELSEKQIFDLVFQPGFSTADQVSELSGRGVGMDVVRRNINQLGGNVSIESEADKGSCIRIILPLTLAILDGQLIKAADQTYIVPLVSIIETSSVNFNELRSMGGQDRLYSFRGEYLPVVRLSELMKLKTSELIEQRCLMMVVESAGQRYALWVDGLRSQQQVVIKSLEENLYRVRGISGATILGDGSVALILDVAGLLKLSRAQNTATHKKVRVKVELG